MSEQRRRGLCAAGLFTVLLGVYLLTAPGRIDSVDGQWRYEVARNWLDAGEPTVSDPDLLALGGPILCQTTRRSYSSYNAAASVTPMPLMVLFRLLPGHSVGRDEFAFSLAGPVFGALLGALLFLAYGWLGMGPRTSLFYTAIFCLATLWWPASVTVFDQNQHALLLLATVLLAWQSGRRQSIGLAVTAGLLGGLLLDYQEIYLLLLPVAGLGVFASPQEGTPEGRHRPKGGTAQKEWSMTPRWRPERAGLIRFAAFALACGVGLGLFLAFNNARFGVPFASARYEPPTNGHPPRWGDPLAGFLSLAISPGKGVFWFSPPLLLAVLGARRFYSRAPLLGLIITVISAIYLLVVSSLTFFAGDWCWGPRYMVVLMPLWALALPFAAARLRAPSRRLVIRLAMAGLLIQCLGISIDHHRFFYEENLPGYFWGAAPWFYFKHSQLLTRPVELAESLWLGRRPGTMRSVPVPTTETTDLRRRRLDSDSSQRWVRRYQIFFLLRPWWGWLRRVPPDFRPVDPAALTVFGALLLMGGTVLLTRFLQVDPIADCGSGTKTGLSSSSVRSSGDPVIRSSGHQSRECGSS